MMCGKWKSVGRIVALMGMVLSCAESPMEPVRAANVVVNILTPATIRSIVVEVSGPGLTPPIIANLPVGSDSTARGTLSLTAGSARRFVVTAVDTAGVTTHRADTTVTLVEGENRALEMRLDPLSAYLSLTVTFGGVRLTVADTSTLSLTVGDSTTLSAIALSPAGDTVPVDSLAWGSSNPAVVTASAGVVRARRDGTAYVTVSYLGAAIAIRAVVQAVPVQLAIVQQPTAGVAGDALTPIVVEVQDSTGLRAAAYRGPVTLTIADNPTDTWILGDTVVNAVNGVATFTAVSVGLPGSGYRLRASAGALPPVTTETFEMTAPSVPVDDAVIAGYGQAYCALTASGEAQCWGANSWGNLGTGDNIGRSSPTPVVGGHRFRSIVTGNGHVCGVTDAGEAYCWGRNQNGALGNGATLPTNVPTLVQGGHNWSRLDAGTITTCGLTTAGEAYCWGYNAGRMGTGDSTHRSVPTPVAAPVRFTSLSVGAFSACAVTAGGWAYCWGLNGGRLGNGERVNALRPVRGAGNLRFAKLAVADLGLSQSPLGCGVTIDNRTVCWGVGSQGEFGTGSAPTDTAFAPVPALIGGMPGRILPLEGTRTCIIDIGGRVSCAGVNAGAIGDGTTEARLSLTPASGDVRFTDLASSGSSNCGIATTGALYCWGLSIPGLDIESLGAPVLIEEISSVGVVSLGFSSHRCAVDGSGVVSCWGQNSIGQLGIGFRSLSEVVPTAVQTSQRFTTVANASNSSCGLTTAGSLMCWGTNSAADLNSPAPVAVGEGRTFTAISAGTSHFCGIGTDSRTYCWGSNTVGQGGAGNTTSPNPFQEVAGALSFSQVVAGGSFSCGLTGTQVYCWGNGYVLSPAGLTESLTPVLVSGAIAVTRIAAGQNHACALAADGTAYCWGFNNSGQIGNGTQDIPQALAAVAGGLRFTDIALGSNHTCGIATDGQTYCWGNNSAGQLGSTVSSSLTPVVAAPGVSFVSLSAGFNGTCGITADRQLYCWGANNLGQLARADALVPTPFAGAAGFRVRAP